MAEKWDIYDSDGRKTGRFAYRGATLNEGEFHLIVNVWHHNSRGEWLIDKRADRGSMDVDGKWETTGGCAIAGESSIEAALRESFEELGITLKPENGFLFARHTCKRTNGGGFFRDVWVFTDETPVSDLRFQPSETCLAKWASVAEIRAMSETGEFLAREFYPYMEDLFAYFSVTSGDR